MTNHVEDWYLDSDTWVVVQCGRCDRRHARVTAVAMLHRDDGGRWDLTGPPGDDSRFHITEMKDQVALWCPVCEIGLGSVSLRNLVKREKAGSALTVGQ